MSSNRRIGSLEGTECFRFDTAPHPRLQRSFLHQIDGRSEQFGEA
jgi:hypothetical protein